jgi:hypothetical protein
MFEAISAMKFSGAKSLLVTCVDSKFTMPKNWPQSVAPAFRCWRNHYIGAEKHLSPQGSCVPGKDA